MVIALHVRGKPKPRPKPIANNSRVPYVSAPRSFENTKRNLSLSHSLETFLQDTTSCNFNPRHTKHLNFDVQEYLDVEKSKVDSDRVRVRVPIRARVVWAGGRARAGAANCVSRPGRWRPPRRPPTRPPLTQRHG
ncbi:hypothetical protein EVAR_98548_1 [Eumeta japonica]|uniref:Uncharacterized protein n=1 Tax=Eumeta variegata TaxID=151549 RepID=A0A4C1YHY3_EUMVA|nr:hypothetical protein EVAR_98548_1 [Eumeta japonica]